MKFNFIYIYLLISAISFGQTKVISEEILIKNDSIELPGTLSYTKTNTPLIIWIHGSGNVDRNGNQGTIIKANYIQKFREAINSKNISFFSYDKRSANPANFKFLKNIIFEDFVNDAKHVINHFKNDKRFSEIVLIGHSQGSLTAMLASENIDKLISLAGPGESFDKAMVKQITKQNELLGKSAENHFKELKKTGTIKTVNPFLISVFKKKNYPFLINWAQFNPTEEIKKINKPILIINGNKDLQVMVEDANNLHKANPKSTLVIIDNMNHILAEIEKDEDNLKSYYSADYPISQQLIQSILNFLNK